MDMVWVLLIFFIFVTLIFVAIALMFPEWVGITGKKALEIQKHQRGDDDSASAKTDEDSSSLSTNSKPRQ